MNRWIAIGAAIFGTIFAVAAYWRLGGVGFRAAQTIAAAFFIGAYAAIVIFGTSEKERTLSIAWQTLLGVILCVIVAAIFGASTNGFLIAILVGLLVGFTADVWAKHLPLP